MRKILILCSFALCCLSAAAQPTFGIQSLIRDPEVLRQRYGLEVIKLPFYDIFKYYLKTLYQQIFFLGSVNSYLAGFVEKRVA